MPSSRHAKMMRSATSPRFAIKIFLNIEIASSEPPVCHRLLATGCWLLPRSYRKQPFSVLNRLSALDIDVDDFAVVLGIDLVHQLHGFDDAEHLALLHLAADLDERSRARFRRLIERADDGRFH